MKSRNKTSFFSNSFFVCLILISGVCGVTPAPTPAPTPALPVWLACVDPFYVSYFQGNATYANGCFDGADEGTCGPVRGAYYDNSTFQQRNAGCVTNDICLEGVCSFCDCSGNCTGSACPVNDFHCGCIYVPITGCCHQDIQCNDGDICTVDTCTGNQCVHTPIPNCCHSVADCSTPAGYSCTTAVCNATGDNTCSIVTNTSTCSVDVLSCYTPPVCDLYNNHSVGRDNTTGCYVTPVPGCCTSSSQCYVPDVCTPYSCVSEACVYTNISNCCRTSADCTQLDICFTYPCDMNVTHQCAPPIPVPNCCLNDTDCNLGSVCETYQCNLTTNRCEVPVPISGCCVVSSDCTNNNVCSNKTCNSNNTCSFAPIPGCCRNDTDCNDNNVCTLDTCNLLDNTCSHVIPPNSTCCNYVSDCGIPPTCSNFSCVANACLQSAVPNCCTLDIQCNDHLVCTSDSCFMNKCLFVPVTTPNCCENSSSCYYPGDVCTSGSCQSNVCVNTTTTGCCLTNSTCAATSYCHPGLCLGNNTCSTSTIPSCCDLDGDCGINNACITFSCAANHTCSNVTIPSPLCCLSNLDCNDNNVCTTDSCDLINHVCVFNPINNCCIQNSNCSSLANQCFSAACNITGNQCYTTPTHSSCCLNDTQCNDFNNCTVDSCATGGYCLNTPIPYCCHTANSQTECAVYATVDPICNPWTCNGTSLMCESTPTAQCCSSQTPCTGRPSDSCHKIVCDVTNVCQEQLIFPGCCTSNIECYSPNVCNDYGCNLITQTCNVTADPLCCATNADCRALLTGNQFCTQSQCMPNFRCNFTMSADPLCCDDSHVCDTSKDGHCNTTSCLGSPAECTVTDLRPVGCCNNVSDCGVYYYQAPTCQPWQCNSNLCQLSPRVANCCTVDSDCNSLSSGCTQGYCNLTLNSCSIRNTYAGCCEFDSDCTAFPDLCHPGVCNRTALISQNVTISGLCTYEPIHNGSYCSVDLDCECLNSACATYNCSNNICQLAAPVSSTCCDLNYPCPSSNVTCYTNECVINNTCHVTLHPIVCDSAAAPTVCQSFALCDVAKSYGNISNPTTGCYYPPINEGGACDDGNLCTVNDYCCSGECVSTTPLDCDNGDPCTHKFCDKNLGCMYTCIDFGLLLGNESVRGNNNVFCPCCNDCDCKSGPTGIATPRCLIYALSVPVADYSAQLPSGYNLSFFNYEVQTVVRQCACDPDEGCTSDPNNLFCDYTAGPPKKRSVNISPYTVNHLSNSPLVITTSAQGTCKTKNPTMPLALDFNAFNEINNNTVNFQYISCNQGVNDSCIDGYVCLTSPATYLNTGTLTTGTLIVTDSFCVPLNQAGQSCPGFINFQATVSSGNITDFNGLCWQSTCINFVCVPIQPTCVVNTENDLFAPYSVSAYESSCAQLEVKGQQSSFKCVGFDTNTGLGGTCANCETNSALDWQLCAVVSSDSIGFVDTPSSRCCSNSKCFVSGVHAPCFPNCVTEVLCTPCGMQDPSTFSLCDLSFGDSDCCSGQNCVTDASGELQVCKNCAPIGSYCDASVDHRNFFVNETSVCCSGLDCVDNKCQKACECDLDCQTSVGLNFECNTRSGFCTQIANLTENGNPSVTSPPLPMSTFVGSCVACSNLGSLANVSVFVRQNLFINHVNLPFSFATNRPVVIGAEAGLYIPSYIVDLTNTSVILIQTTWSTGFANSSQEQADAAAAYLFYRYVCGNPISYHQGNFWANLSGPPTPTLTEGVNDFMGSSMLFVAPLNLKYSNGQTFILRKLTSGGNTTFSGPSASISLLGAPSVECNIVFLVEGNLYITDVTTNNPFHGVTFIVNGDIIISNAVTHLTYFSGTRFISTSGSITFIDSVDISSCDCGQCVAAQSHCSSSSNSVGCCQGYSCLGDICTCLDTTINWQALGWSGCDVNSCCAGLVCDINNTKNCVQPSCATVSNPGMLIGVPPNSGLYYSVYGFFVSASNVVTCLSDADCTIIDPSLICASAGTQIYSALAPNAANPSANQTSICLIGSHNLSVNANYVCPRQGLAGNQNLDVSSVTQYSDVVSSNIVCLYSCDPLATLPPAPETLVCGQAGATCTNIGNTGAECCGNLVCTNNTTPMCLDCVVGANICDPFANTNVCCPGAFCNVNTSTCQVQTNCFDWPGIGLDCSQAPHTCPLNQICDPNLYLCVPNSCSSNPSSCLTSCPTVPANTSPSVGGGGPPTIVASAPPATAPPAPQAAFYPYCVSTSCVNGYVVATCQCPGIQLQFQVTNATSPAPESFSDISSTSLSSSSSASLAYSSPVSPLIPVVVTLGTIGVIAGCVFFFLVCRSKSRKRKSP